MRTTDLNISGIYQFRNLVNNKIYIGSAESFRVRWKNHCSELRNQEHTNLHLQNAFNKYGEENFVFEILITCPKDLLIWYEQQFLDQWNPEYNICRVAGNTLGRFHTKETKARISLTKSTGDENHRLVNCVQCNKSIRLNRGNTEKFETDGLCSKCRNRIRERKHCPGCGKLILLKSNFCGHCSQLGEKSHSYKDGSTSMLRICNECGEKISSASKGLCQKCYSKTLVGEGNPNYKNGDYVNSQINQ